MDIFLTLASNIFPLYILIALGYIGGKWLDINLHSMARVGIYILGPMVNLGAMMGLDLNPEYTALPFLILAASAIIGYLSYALAHHYWKDNNANLIAMSSVTGNAGYFGIPLVLAFFKPEYVGIYFLMNAGRMIAEQALGYYIGARGDAGIKDAVIKILKLPILHAIWIGLLLNILGVRPSPTVTTYTNYATGAWILSGMMMIGIAFGMQKKIDFDARLMGWLFAAKFVAWPLFGFLFIVTDYYYFHTYNATIYQMMVIFCTVPLGANLVAFSANLKLHAERMAGAVLVSTFLAMITVPGGMILFDRLMPK